MSEKKAKLKPCPFCGRVPACLYDCMGNLIEIVCYNPECDLTVETTYWETEASIIAAWNRRAK